MSGTPEGPYKDPSEGNYCNISAGISRQRDSCKVYLRDFFIVMQHLKQENVMHDQINCHTLLAFVMRKVKTIPYLTKKLTQATPE